MDTISKQDQENDDEIIVSEYYLSACFDAMQTLESFDPMTQDDTERIKKIKGKILDMVEFCIDNMHNDILPLIELNKENNETI